MPLQNRVDPWGRLQVVEARGTLMGNRGILHNTQKEIIKASTRKGWVTCRLAFEGRKRNVFNAGSYSELFFLDEATAFSAGHRPCAECRRERYNEFKSAWVKANADLTPSLNPPITDIDNIMHAERVTRGGGKASYEAPVADLPSGTFIELGAEAFLVWEKRLLRWSFSGYCGALEPPAPSTRVRVLTPAGIVRMFRSGFIPNTLATETD